VDFSRLDGVSAPSSTVTMPQVFSIANSATTFDISDNNTINFIYTPTDFSSFGSVSYRIDGDCINTFSGNLNIASGSLSISANNLGSLIAGPNEVVPSACAITASFTHTNSGSIDAAFGGGKFTANRDVDIAMTIQE
ncbi:MAG: hypothetical protein OEX11_08485, partial [Nitrosomonas sp.]|nr:hypothetical protein [Nitrosomonas sp.]